MNIAYNMDFLEAMREMPDNAFDLAVVDPPYGDGLHADDGGGKGWFTKYNQACSQNVNVERERERTYRGTTDLAGGSTATSTHRGGQTLHVWTPQEQPELREQAAHGRRNTQKNHNVGRCAGTGIF